MSGVISALTGRGAAGAVRLQPVEKKSLANWLRGQSRWRKTWVESTGFDGSAGTFCIFPDDSGRSDEVLVGVDLSDLIANFGTLCSKLPAGTYRVDTALTASQARQAALGWGLATYRFDLYKKSKRNHPRLVWPEGCPAREVKAALAGTFLVRDLINTPTNAMGPAELASAARTLARKHGAKVSVTTGDQLLEKKFPAIHAVGRASVNKPRLVDLRWGTRGPSITLVGKGVCFDTGGLDLKPAAGMKLMKKDMGGAAHVLGVASMVMEMKLPVRLRVLIPAVENSVSGNAFRPLDVLSTRKGLTVEVGNTDAEGRLVLADALTVAGKVDLLVDFATLTGAARVALGTSLPAMFSTNDDVAEKLLACGAREDDLLWRMPLHKPSRAMLNSKVADLNNVADSGYGGAITAALFLKEFVDESNRWVHIDVMAWNLSGSSSRPAGGEAMGIRAVYGLIAETAGAARSKKKTIRRERSQAR